MAVPRRTPSVQTQVRRLVSFAGSIPEWVDSAACTQTDPDLFFPSTGGNNSAKAKAICAGCTVRVECLERALEFEASDRDENQVLLEPHGVYGGLTGKERRRLIRETRSDRKGQIKANAFVDIRNGLTARQVSEKYDIALDTAYRWGRQIRESEEGGAA